LAVLALGVGLAACGNAPEPLNVGSADGTGSVAAVDAVVDTGPAVGSDAAEDAAQGAAAEDVASACPSGEKWQWGDEGSPLMHPGGACVACHKADSHAPKFLFGGTVFSHLHTEDDCNSAVLASGGPAVVELTDANGKVYQANVNAVGNFFVKANKNGGSLAAPYTARVLQGGKERKMLGSQTSGDCNSCHTAKGDGGAPGRIRAP
jgi:hypothetical protein